MNNLKYFMQFVAVIFLFLIYKLLGLKYSRKLSSFIFKYLGPLFRSKKIIISNLTKAFPNLGFDEKENIIENVWSNYGKIFAEYMFIKNLSETKKIIVENQDILEKIKKEKKPVIFISGHFNNFELLAMIIEEAGVDVAALYRPLNNFFLNKMMVNIRKKYICKKQIPKGITGVKDMAKEFKNGTSLALMIDQRVSQGVKIDFFNHPAYTTTLPAQFVKKYGCTIVPVYIERTNKHYFKVKIDKPINFDETNTLDQITLSLNNWLEKKIIQNPDQWIWSHNRWK